jgi:hypothetical protein
MKENNEELNWKIKLIKKIRKQNSNHRMMIKIKYKN